MATTKSFVLTVDIQLEVLRFLSRKKLESLRCVNSQYNRLVGGRNFAHGAPLYLIAMLLVGTDPRLLQEYPNAIKTLNPYLKLGHIQKFVLCKGQKAVAVPIYIRVDRVVLFTDASMDVTMLDAIIPLRDIWTREKRYRLNFNLIVTIDDVISKNGLAEAKIPTVTITSDVFTKIFTEIAFAQSITILLNTIPTLPNLLELPGIKNCKILDLVEYRTKKFALEPDQVLDWLNYDRSKYSWITPDWRDDTIMLIMHGIQISKMEELLTRVTDGFLALSGEPRFFGLSANDFGAEQQQPLTLQPIRRNIRHPRVPHFELQSHKLPEQVQLTSLSTANYSEIKRRYGARVQLPDS